MEKYKMLKVLFTGALISVASSGFAFELSFNWGDLELCNSGTPNTVGNPEFTLVNVPEGTNFIRFKMVDKDVSGYNHGGGLIAYNGEQKIPAGVFNYKSPCPPGMVHTYEWSATAQSKKNGGKLGVAKAQRDYPE